MAKDFQTSFIPTNKTGGVSAGGGLPRRLRKDIFGSILFVMTLIIFIATATLTGYSIWRENSLKKEIAALELELVLIQQSIVDGEISEIEKMNSRLEQSGVLLNKHIAPALIFDLFEELTLPTLTFTKFNFEADGEKVKVVGNGLAANFESIVHQSDVLGAKNNIFRDVLFSNLQRNVSGTINFSFSTFVNRQSASYLSRDFSEDTQNEAGTAPELTELEAFEQQNREGDPSRDNAPEQGVPAVQRTTDSAETNPVSPTDQIDPEVINNES